LTRSTAHRLMTPQLAALALAFWRLNTTLAPKHLQDDLFSEKIEKADPASVTSTGEALSSSTFTGGQSA